MASASTQHLTTPRRDDLGLQHIRNRSGLVCSILPNGGIFALEHVRDGHSVMINQTLGSPIAAGLGSLLLRVGGRQPRILSLAGATARGRLGIAEDHCVWAGETSGLAHEVILQLQPDQDVWLWRIEVSNRGPDTLSCDAVLIQDLGLGEPGFLMNNEAYASQYLDHHIAAHPSMGHILMERQNLAQAERHPWVAHGCREGAVGFATDLRQLLGPAHRDADQVAIPFGTSLASIRLQHESGCAALQSAAVTLAPGAVASWTFFGIFRGDHPAASGDADLALIDEALSADVRSTPSLAALSSPLRSYLLDAPSAVADSLSEAALHERYPRQSQHEWRDGRLLSFFTPAEAGNRHVVLRDKERTMLRRHGAILVSGTHMLPDERTLCLTCWMHGVFGAQLCLGNTSFHRLLSVSRDPYNITRGSGLRLLVDAGEGWRLLTVPSVFEMGLADCCWVYQLGTRTLTVRAVVSGAEGAVQWKVAVAGPACRFLVCGHLVLGEQEFAHAAQVEIDAARKRCSFRPEPGGLWSQRYPQAVYHLVTSTPESLEALGSDELLYGERPEGVRALRSGAYVVLRTSATSEFVFAVVGSLTDPRHAEELAVRYAGGVSDTKMCEQAEQHWRTVTRGMHLEGGEGNAAVSAIDATFPWLVHDAMVHLTVPHGLEQYTGGAWGTRDVCQGPLELLLALEHDAPAKAILRIVFAQQYVQRGDWPQWFMLEPYSAIQDREAHGDVIVWPLKALCDYVEATGDFAILEESIPWRREDTLERSTAADPIAVHVDKLIATVRERFVPGTHLLRYGNGDWNDALQPVDPAKRDWMVSSWTVALLYEQLCRYAAVLRRARRADGAAEETLAAAIREDFNRFLIRDGTVAGYGVFSPQGSAPELLFHPTDPSTGVSYSLLPMTQGMLGGLFTPPQTEHHLSIVRNALTFPDGMRLMDRPVPYHGGPEVLFKRAESAAFFGREIGLMYTHAHLRQAQAMALLGEAQEAWDALLVVNPIAVTDRLEQATLRQRNSYFSSSDAAFRDRYQASAEWQRIKGQSMAVDGGWRIYSSGPGVYTNVLVSYVLGMRRDFGTRITKPCLPPALRALRLTWPGGPWRDSPLQ